MNTIRVIALVATLLCCLVLAGMVLAQTSTNYGLERTALANAGGPMNSANYAMNSSLGQASAIGISQSSNFKLSAGYWTRAKWVTRFCLPMFMKEFVP